MNFPKFWKILAQENNLTIKLECVTSPGLTCHSPEECALLLDMVCCVRSCSGQISGSWEICCCIHNI